MGEAYRVLMLVEIRKVQVAVGDVAGAGRMMDEARAGTIEDTDDRVFALAHVARNQGGVVHEG